MQDSNINVTGRIVFWNVAVETDRQMLASRLLDIHAEDCIPHERTAFSAAKIALTKVFKGDYRIEKLKDGEGLTVEKITRGETENTYSQVGYVLVDDKTGTLETVRITDYSIDDRWALVDRINDQFAIEKNLCSANSVGLALAKAIDKNDGYRLRPTGGVYFLPSFSGDRFQKIAEVFEACGVVGRTMVHRMEVGKDDQTLRAVHHTIVENIAERVAEMREELAGGLKKAGRNNRKAEVDALLEQTARYEGLLEQSLTEVRAELENVKVQLAMETVATAGNLFAGIDDLVAA